MAHPTLEYIRGLRKTLETKKAEVTGENPPSSIPGSENDKPIPASAKKPDKETRDQTMVPNSGLSTAGAGDDSTITHQNDLTADQAALTPAKKPEVTGDAEAQVPGGKTAEQKTAEQLGAEILAGVTAWEQKQAAAAKVGGEQKKAADTQGPGAGQGTAEGLITDKGKEPEQLKPVQEPNKKPQETPDAMAPATGEGSSGETAAAAKAAETGKEAECCKDGKCGKCAKCKAAAKAVETGKDAECCKDGKCGKCAKCKAAAKAAAGDAQKKAGALDMELTSDILAKLAAVMLSTEEGTKLAEETLAKAAGAEAAEKTLNFLRTQNDLAQKQAEYEQGRQDAEALIKGAQDAGEAPASDGITEIADTLDEMVQNGELTDDEADQVVVEIAQAIAGSGAAPAAGGDAGAAAAPAAGGDTCAQGCEPKKEEKETAPAKEEKSAAQKIAEILGRKFGKTAQVVEPGAAAGDAAINAQVAVPPENLDAGSLPQGGADDITPDDVAGAIDTLVQNGDITPEEANQLVDEITGGDAGDAGAAGAAPAEGEVSPEEIATVLQDAVEKGELKPEEVQQVLTELEGVPAPDAGAAAAGGDAGAAGAGAAAGAAPASTTPAEGEPKTAASQILAAIKAARTQKAAAAKPAAK